MAWWQEYLVRFSSSSSSVLQNCQDSSDELASLADISLFAAMAVTRFVYQVREGRDHGRVNCSASTITGGSRGRHSEVRTYTNNPEVRVDAAW